MLQNILRPDWLERKPRYAFAIGFVYSIIAIITAYFVFPKSQGIASLAFLSVLLVPSLNNILAIEEKQDSASKKFSVKKIFIDHADVLQIYLLLFLGIFLAYAMLSIKFPNLLVQGVFDSQLRIIGANIGNAVNPGIDFFSIFLNNMKIMFIFLILSLIFGAGSVLFLAWNASAWGVIFAYIAGFSGNPFDSFFQTFLKVMPHMLLEAGGYFFAIVAGGLMAQAVLRESIGSKKFDYVMKDGFVFLTVSVLLLIIGALVEVLVAGAL